MTGNALALELKRKVNKLDTSSNRSLRLETALAFLTDAYIKLVRAKYRQGATKEDVSAFQRYQITTDELNHITETAEMDVQSDGDNYFVEVSEIEDYWVHLRSQLNCSSPVKTIYWNANPSIVSLDALGPLLEDPFNKPAVQSPVIYYEAGRIVFPAPGFTVSKYRVTYLKQIQPITADAEIEAPFTDEITDAAALLLLESWVDQRVQSKATVDNVLDNK